MTIFEWFVDSMTNYPEFAGETDVVVVVNWICTGTDGVNTARTAGATGIPFIADDPFIPYADLTNDIVIGWVQDALGVDGVTDVTDNLDGQLVALATPQVTQPLPWG